MNHHWERKLLIIWIFLLLERVHSAQLVKDGQGSCSAYPRSVYRAFNYQPFCGTLAPAETLPWTYQSVCNTALSLYRTIPDTFALYDSTGIRLPNTAPIGSGTELCMCYSMAEVQPATGAPRQANFCTFVDRTGAELLGGGYAQGTYEVGGKALPQCFAVDVAAITASIAAAAGQVASTSSPPPAPASSTSQTPQVTKNAQPTEPPPASTVTRGGTVTTVITATNTSGGNTQGNQGGSSSSSVKSDPPGGPASVGIWMPILISAIVGGVGIYYKRRQYLLEKKKASEAAYQGGYPKQGQYPYQGRYA